VENKLARFNDNYERLEGLKSLQAYMFDSNGDTFKIPFDLTNKQDVINIQNGVYLFEVKGLQDAGVEFQELKQKP
jgi:hypothetical protein